MVGVHLEWVFCESSECTISGIDKNSRGMVSYGRMITTDTQAHITPSRANGSGEIIDVEVADFEPLTPQEDSFVLGMIEYNGNVTSAYRAAFGENLFPAARAKQLLAKPNVSLRIKEIHEALDIHAMFSLSGHLGELADIRDLAKECGQLKTALGAERARGEAMGVYAREEKSSVPVAIQINMVSHYDGAV